MKRKKQGVKIDVTESLFKILLSGVPQGSILGPILLHIFTNNLLFLINESKRANITHDLHIKKGVKKLLRLLEKESEVAIKWSSDDNMIVNPKKFQAILINRQSKPNNNCCLTINNAETKSKESATLLGIEMMID